MEDLIAFGVKHDLPEAVGIGEKLLSESGEAMPYHLAKAVKTYSLLNNEKYRSV